MVAPLSRDPRQTMGYGLRNTPLKKHFKTPLFSPVSFGFNQQNKENCGNK